jgi:hypothetical protein
MRARMLAGISATLLMLAPCVFAQDDAATQEAKRQSVANSNRDSSPAQTIAQAIAFERYKDLAAEREERKASGSSGAGSSAVTNSADRTAAVRKKTRK